MYDGRVAANIKSEDYTRVWKKKYLLENKKRLFFLYSLNWVRVSCQFPMPFFINKIYFEDFTIIRTLICTLKLKKD